ncbi:MAG TPA: hypothetical protein VLI93_15340 [Acetobacteraceae bacterium]|nr:hypothetical protein [Acetobacteraceae bacterium]
MPFTSSIGRFTEAILLAGSEAQNEVFFTHLRVPEYATAGRGGRRRKG